MNSDTTETPMRERIARAICKDLDVPASVGIWEDYLDTADAVLDAMREPTCEMLEDGFHAFRAAKSSGVGGQTIENSIRMQCYREGAAWRAMVDAAKEGK